MSADHLLHVNFERGWFGFSFECIGDPADHYCLYEKTCDCDCEMCSGASPDHWGCDRQEHDLSFDGRAPCETELDTGTCWVHQQDCPIEETFGGDWPKRITSFPVPVTVHYDGDGEWTTLYAGDPIGHEASIP